MQFRNTVADLCQNTTTSFRAADGETGEIHILRGVKQGDPPSPILFNICRDPLFCRLELDGQGWNAARTALTALGYADDTAVVSDSRESLLKNLDIVKRVL